MATAKFFGKAMLSAFKGEINITTNTIKVALLTATTAPDQDTWDYFDDAAATEITGTGYTSGGATISSPTIDYTGATNVFAFKAGAATTWTSATFTARYAVVYNSTPGTNATRPVISFVDFGADVSVTAGTLTLTWDAAGIATITVA